MTELTFVAKQEEDTEKKASRFFTHFGPPLLQLGRKVPSLRASDTCRLSPLLVLSLLPPLPLWNFLGTRAPNREKGKKPGIWPTVSEPGDPFPVVRGLSWSPRAPSCSLLGIGLYLVQAGDTRVRDMVDSPQPWWHFKFWSSTPFCLLLVNSQRHQ